MQGRCARVRRTRITPKFSLKFFGNKAQRCVRVIGSDACEVAGFQIRFLSDDDVAEDGVDGGGLFKEFLTLLLRELMNMDR